MIGKVNDVDWANWEPEVRATLLFVQRGDEVLLIRKKRGLGAGKINGPGGQIEPGESPIACAIRETQEELLITPQQVESRGELYFHAEDMPRIHAHLFVAGSWLGTPTETAEAIPHWIARDALPFDEMWEDDRLWLPLILAGHVVRGWFTFAGESMIDHVLEIDGKHSKD